VLPDDRRIDMAHPMVHLALLLVAALIAGSATTIVGLRTAANDRTASASVVANPLSVMVMGMACFFSVAALILTAG
jgi:hypothetical protein